jgi:LysM repeat protein
MVVQFVPAAIGLIKLGRTVYKVATSPATQKLAQQLIKKYGWQEVKKASKKDIQGSLTKAKYNKITKGKDPSLIDNLLSGTKVKPTDKGRHSPADFILVGKNRYKAFKKGVRNLGRAEGAGVVGALAVGYYLLPSKERTEVNKDLKENKNVKNIQKKLKDKVKVEFKSTPADDRIGTRSTDSKKMLRINNPPGKSFSSVTIKKGDTYSDLAQKFGTTVSKLRELNKYADKKLPIGKRMKIK